MSYSKFTLEDVEQTFNLKEQTQELFADIPKVQPTDWLMETLHKAKLMPAKSEKSRSELLIMPILLTIAEKNEDKITIFSGENLDGDIDQGLNGECDFILSKSPKSFSLKAPIFGLVEAKQNIIENSMGQCIAQMLGAQYFNEKRHNQIPVIFGCVSNGDVWQFMKLEQSLISIDSQKYYLDSLEELLGVLQLIIDNIKN
jgi:hypothetical protein